MHRNYDNSTVLTWYEMYKDHRIPIVYITSKFKVKHHTLLSRFKKLGLKLRAKGFRVGICRGEDGKDVEKLRYLWFYKFGYKKRALRKGLEFTLTAEEFIELVTSDCFYCGKSYLEDFRTVNRSKINMLTVDRFDSKLGYTKENCRACCKVCNTIKMDLDPVEWIAHMKRIICHLNGKL